jgi:hypothetical protein
VASNKPSRNTNYRSQTRLDGVVVTFEVARGGAGLLEYEGRINRIGRHSDNRVSPIVLVRLLCFAWVAGVT